MINSENNLFAQLLFMLMILALSICVDISACAFLVFCGF